MEDLDVPRVVPGAAEDILGALRKYALEWDGEVVWQSYRVAFDEEALVALRSRGLVYGCACSRGELQRAASGPLGVEAVYPGTCRDGLAAGRLARAVRFRVPPGVIAFDDAIAGRIEEDVAAATGDFVIKRADGPFAYQLAVVVDDAAQGVTQVVRGGDLLSSTARQIALQQALELSTPSYAHLPLVVAADGTKLGKRDGAPSLPTPDEPPVRSTLAAALRILAIDVGEDEPRAMLDEGLRRFDPKRVRSGAVRTATAR